MFVDNARNLIQIGEHESYFTWAGSSLARKYWARLERYAMEKHL
jgi:hypothetical protein